MESKPDVLPLLFDFIGDVHGCANQLRVLLDKLKYKEVQGFWSHPHGNCAVFVGDFIDRGPDPIGVLDIVHSMVAQGRAIALMGNHEYNLLCYTTATKDQSVFLRPHNRINNHMHAITTEAFKEHPDKKSKYLTWFRTLPIFADLGQCRAVHACWDREHIQNAIAMNGGLLHRVDITVCPAGDPSCRVAVGHGLCLTEDFLHLSVDHKSEPFILTERLLKGPEMHLPAGKTAMCEDGNIRNSFRVAWWKDASSAQSIADIAKAPPQALEQMKRMPLSADMRTEAGLVCYPAEEVPVFVGHYWAMGDKPSVWARNMACVDWSAAVPDGGHLAAYTYRGEPELSDEHWVWV